MTIFSEYAAKFLSYETFKIIHMVGIIFFMGNIIITGWWKVMADRTGDYRIIAFAQRQGTITDWIFTLGGVLVLLFAALGMVAHMDENIMKEIYTTRWLTWGFNLFLVSGVIWVLILVPMQYLQGRMARKFADTGDIPDRYWLYGKIWVVFGILATIIPMANIYWMVMKG